MDDKNLKKVCEFKIDKKESSNLCFVNPLILIGIIFLICLFMFIIYNNYNDEN